MATIFISYRRGRQSNWVARQLRDELSKEIDTFLDRETPSGDEWARRIRLELQDCRIFLALIGSDWRRPSNLKRLNDDSDWVRQEILAALDRRQSIVIFPVYIDSRPD